MKFTAVLLSMICLIAQTALAQVAQPSATAVNEVVIAVVLGKKLTLKDKDKLGDIVLGVLLEQFAKDNKIEPTAEELDVFIVKTAEMYKRSQVEFEEERKKLIVELKASNLSESEREGKEAQLRNIASIQSSDQETKILRKELKKQLDTSERQSSRSFVTRWKINKALYAKYGGRVIFQQLGAEPLDAYRDLLKEQERKGAFQILDKQYVPSFWRYFTDEAMHVFYSKDEGAKFMNTPWWMMEEPAEG